MLLLLLLLAALAQCIETIVGGVAFQQQQHAVAAKSFISGSGVRRNRPSQSLVHHSLQQ